VALAASLVAVAAGCGGQSAHDRVQGYVRDANAVEQASAPAFRRAQATYVAFARGALPASGAAAQLAGAEDTIRAARGRLARLDPPPEARELHRRLLAVYDMNISLADETTRLAAYSPAAAAALGPLAQANKRLSRELRVAAGKPAQQQALARYAAALGGVLASLRRLRPPALLAAAHRTQVARLDSARSLALRLARAIGSGDARRTASLLVRFRSVGARSSAGSVSLSPAALRAYGRRYQAIATAETSLRREEARLRAKLK
jgi:hypothetical protein